MGCTVVPGHLTGCPVQRGAPGSASCPGPQTRNCVCRSEGCPGIPTPATGPSGVVRLNGKDTGQPGALAAEVTSPGRRALPSPPSCRPSPLPVQETPEGHPGCPGTCLLPLLYPPVLGTPRPLGVAAGMTLPMGLLLHTPVPPAGEWPGWGRPGWGTAGLGMAGLGTPGLGTPGWPQQGRGLGLGNSMSGGGQWGWELRA